MSEVARLGRAHLYGAMVIGFFVVLPALGLRRLDPFALPEVLASVGLAVLVAGALLSYASFWFFIRYGRGTAFPTDPPKELVVRGPYLYVRNPMYIGNLAIILGAALYLRSPAVLVYAGAMCAVTHLYVTLSEEPALDRRYPGSYARYVATTRRWLPRWPHGPAVARVERSGAPN